MLPDKRGRVDDLPRIFKPGSPVYPVHVIAALVFYRPAVPASRRILLYYRALSSARFLRELNLKELINLPDWKTIFRFFLLSIPIGACTGLVEYLILKTQSASPAKLFYHPRMFPLAGQKPPDTGLSEEVNRYKMPALRRPS